jgi:hypothetical protein
MVKGMRSDECDPRRALGRAGVIQEARRPESSVVVPAYNRRAIIGRAIRPLLDAGLRGASRDRGRR